jgi:hypothetical protein
MKDSDNKNKKEEEEIITTMTMFCFQLHFYGRGVVERAVWGMLWE